MRAWKSGVVEHSSPFKIKLEVVQSLPSEVRKVCEQVAGCSRGQCSGGRQASRGIEARDTESLLPGHRWRRLGPWPPIPGVAQKTGRDTIRRAG